MPLTLFISALLLLWLIVCAVQDYRQGTVSNWLTLPPLGLALIARFAGVVTTPWWTIGIVWLLALILWWRGALGGADAKAWMLFAFLGAPILLGIYLGLVIWCAATTWALKYLGFDGKLYSPGFPGYLLGMGSAVLLWVAQKTICSTQFILLGGS